MTGTSANFTYNPPYNLAQPGSVTYSGGGGFTLGGARSIQDARRMMQTPRIPSAEYPDGYLGTISSRRGDRLMNSIGNRATQRSYQRGVHKGERLDPADYYWPPDFNPMTGLEFEARGERWTAGRGMEAMPQLPFTAVNEQRRAQLARMRPAWR